MFAIELALPSLRADGFADLRWRHPQCGSTCIRFAMTTPSASAAYEADLLIVSEQLYGEYPGGFPRRTLFKDRFVACGWDENDALTHPITVDGLRMLRFAQYVTGERLNLADRALDELGWYAR